MDRAHIETLVSIPGLLIKQSDLEIFVAICIRSLVSSF
jgi:hypothetical protein